MSNPGPAVEGTSNPSGPGGNQMGIVVGTSATETIGFFGSTGAVQGTAAANGDTLAHLVTYLTSLGLLR